MPAQSTTDRFLIPAREFEPACLALYLSGELQRRAQQAIDHLAACPTRRRALLASASGLERLRTDHHLRLLAVACEATGVFYWGLWDYLAQRPNVARVLYTPAPLSTWAKSSPSASAPN